MSSASRSSARLLDREVEQQREPSPRSAPRRVTPAKPVMLASPVTKAKPGLGCSKCRWTSCGKCRAAAGLPKPASNKAKPASNKAKPAPSPLPLPALDVPPNASLATLKRELATLLWTHRAQCFAIEDPRKAINVAGSFKVGPSTNPGFLAYVREGRSGFIAHPTKNVGVCLHSTKVSPLKWRAYELAKRILEKVDADYAAGEFVVQFAWMSSKDHQVKCHVDACDVSFQYALTLGDFTGAVLRSYTRPDKTAWVDFAAKERIVRFDGRLPHEVLMNGFIGNRFSVIFYKNYDSRKKRDDPVLDAPGLVDEAALL